MMMKREREQRLLMEEQQKREREKALRADEQAYFARHGGEDKLLRRGKSLAPQQNDVKYGVVDESTQHRVLHRNMSTEDTSDMEPRRKPKPLYNPSHQQVACSPISRSVSSTRNNVNLNIIPKPCNLECTVVNADGVDLKWQLPPFGNALSIELSWRNMTQCDKEWHIGSMLITGQKVRKKNLIPNCIYKFRVRCVSQMEGGLPG
jgi:hypothetical protein